VTGFDILAALVILGSTAAGAVRGAVREIVSLFSFALAAFIALIAMPVTAPIGRGLIDPDWIGSVAAVIVSFLLLYFGIRMLGSLVSRSARGNPLGVVDRIVGVVIGLARGLVLMGAIHLVVLAALPGERTPGWLTNAALRPVTAGAARAIQMILPAVGRGADAVTPVVSSSVNRGFNDDPALPPTQSRPTSPPPAP
jgi:membrane protein required for colicin V production